MRRLTLAALAAVTVVAAVGTANPGMADEGEGKDCVVEYLDERGEVRETTTVPEGSKLGSFRCVGGVWEFSWDPYGPDESVTAPRLQVKPDGTVTAEEFVRPTRARDLTLREMAGIAQAVMGTRGEFVFERAVVVVDDGRERTPQEVEALLAGKDTTGAKILGTFDHLDPASTVEDIAGETGTQEPVVVYLLSGIWDAIVDAVNWVVDGVNEVIDWLDDHCTWFPPPPPVDTIVTCQW